MQIRLWDSGLEMNGQENFMRSLSDLMRSIQITEKYIIVCLIGNKKEMKIVKIIYLYVSVCVMVSK